MPKLSLKGIPRRYPSGNKIPLKTRKKIARERAKLR